MHLAKYQKGMSATGWLIILLVVGFTLLCLFRMVPAYVDNRYIQEGLLDLSEQGDKIEEMSPNEIRRQVGRFFQMNNVRSQSSKSIEVERLQEKTLVHMNYEVRVPIIYNIDVVMTFNNTWDSSRPYECCKPEAGTESERE
ncbi:DUF4845 domain-containing protein [Pseudomaricurvus sp.]|uniref:DUF4845 domain-containing protein n=1 Tax=Pseudomaricurvus sp. TaxID=2004510 RepID=UPI003F6C60F6